MLAVASEERFAPFEQSPTLKEAGYNVVTEHWRGVMASNEVPNDVVEKLNDMIKKVVQEPEFKQFLASSKMYDGYLESEMFANLVVEQTVN